MDIKNVTVEDLCTMNQYTVQWFFEHVPIDWKVRKEFVRLWNEASDHYSGISMEGTLRNRTDAEQEKLNEFRKRMNQSKL